MTTGKTIADKVRRTFAGKVMSLFFNMLSAAAAAAAAKLLHSCPTLCDPIDVKVRLLSCVQLLATRWTAAYQAPPSLGFSRQEYWSGVSLPSPEIRLLVIKVHYP